MKGWIDGHPRVFSVGAQIPSQPLIMCQLGGVDVHALIDTGSMKSFVSKTVFDRMRPLPVLHRDSPNCIGITGEPLQVAGTIQADLLFSPGSTAVPYSGHFLVSSNLFEPLQCVLGWDFLTGNNLQLSFLGDGTYSLDGVHGKTPLNPHKSLSASPSPASVPAGSTTANQNEVSPCLLVQSTSRGPVPVKLQSDICVPSRTEVIVTCSLPRSSKEQIGMTTPISDSTSLPPGIVTPYTVCQASSCYIPMRLMNSANIDIQLQAGTRVSEFIPLVEQEYAALSQSRENLNVNCSASIPTGNIKHQLEAALSPCLVPADKQQLLDTLLSFSDVFEESLGHTDVMQHKIDTGDARPIRQYPRRLPYAYRDETRKQVAEMLDQGVIQPSHSPWASPIVLVKKKDGSFRFCIDYRKLNEVTRKDAHPLPRVDDLLDALHGSQMFSTLDLRSGYWQLSVDPNDREKTAFVTPDGLWEFLRLPFGVSGGPATFQRAIEIVLSGLNFDTCLCYFDDVIIPSNNLQQHCDRLASVLSRFRKHNLRVKASKCCFGADQVLFLGHVVSAAGVHTDPKKIKAVSELAPPKSVEQVRTFLGLAGYYRRFIPNFASLAVPLINLTKKGSKFRWDTAEQTSFISLKQLLCSAPVLAYPQFDKQFILQTDASDLGLGAVLTQKDTSGYEHVIAYASRSLSDREKNYSATEKEALAVIFATDHFRAYLLGKKFILFTDHQALRWLHTVEPKGRLARWVMQLQEFDFVSEHRPGTANGNADALSRLPLQNPSSFPEHVSPAPSPAYATTMSPGYSLQEAQREDPKLRTIIELKSNNLPKPPLFAWARDPDFRVFWHCWDALYIVNGLLVKSSGDSSRALPEYAFVIPANLRPSVLQGIHGTPFAGHFGVKKTLMRAKNRYFWPKMSVQIKDFVRSCEICARTKLNYQSNRAPLQSIEVNEPFVFWAMDYMGPLPETVRGNKHLLVVMDHFTKWCEVFPTKDQRAHTVAEILVNRVFSRFGPPTIIHSDQGRNFESNLMHEICSLMGIHKSRTTAYHPQCDGQVERQNRTLQEMLAAFVSAHKDDWDEWVSLVVYAYNTVSHESTGFSPYELVFGRDARSPLELDLDIPLKNPCSQSEYSQAIRQTLRNIKQLAQSNLHQSRQKQQDTRSADGHKWVPFHPGSSVWLKRPKPWKFGCRWVGPYVVVYRQGVNYKIRSKSGSDMIVHHDNLKQCIVPGAKGLPQCPVPESLDINFVEGGAFPQGEEEGPRQNDHHNQRPARLRQNINPPLRFGDFVTH